MKTLGFITKLDQTNEKNNAITIWDSTTQEVAIKHPIPTISNQEYNLLDIVEYDLEKNIIIPINTTDFTKEEQLQLIKIFKVIIEEPELNKTFLHHLDIICTPNAQKKNK